MMAVLSVVGKLEPKVNLSVHRQWIMLGNYFVTGQTVINQGNILSSGTYTTSCGDLDCSAWSAATAIASQGETFLVSPVFKSISQGSPATGNRTPEVESKAVALLLTPVPVNQICFISSEQTLPSVTPA
jgi:hypothetical protein